MTAGTGSSARLITGSMSRLSDRIDTGSAEGSSSARSPDGSTRLFGARAPGYAAEITSHDWRGLSRLATAGSVGWYQAWEAGEWESPDPVASFASFMRNAKAMGDMARAKGPWRWAGRVSHALRRNSRKGARSNISAHYDLGNDFYACWLDPSMSYSSASWAGLAPDADSETAQVHKVDRSAERSRSSPGASVSEIGCGWGFLARRFPQAPGARVVGISSSDEQSAWARERAVPGTDYRHQDYRDVDGQFDAIASVEMVEAVGRRFWPSWFDCIARHSKPGGRAAIQFIAIRDDSFDAYAA
ncbi:hypothetical protein OY671_008185, partial [Metschnikowia pulcherrima]